MYLDDPNLPTQFTSDIAIIRVPKFSLKIDPPKILVGLKINIS
jgi:hypothetical protein